MKTMELSVEVYLFEITGYRTAIIQIYENIAFRT